MNRLFGPTRVRFSMPATAAGLMALMLLTVPLHAQDVQLLPPTRRDGQQPQLAPGLGVPGFADPAGQPQMAPPPPPCIPLLPAGDARQPSAVEAPRLLQNIKADFTWLTGSGSHAFVVNDIDLYATVPVPFHPDRAPLRITPGISIHDWGGPDSAANVGHPDLPPQAYDLSLAFDWRPRLARWLFLDLGVTPALATDFHEINEHSFRLRGRVVGIVALSERLQFVGGILYLDRNNTKLLPVLGVLWSPTDDIKLELVFPQPKASYRWTIDCGVQWWVYVAGEFGGGSWEIQRANGAADSVDYSDIRAILGVEAVTKAGLKGHFEIGYVFNRRIDYTSATPDFKPDSTVMLRAGLAY